MPPTPRYRLAAFDFDGTLADSFGWFAAAMPAVADRFGFRWGDGTDAPLDAMRGLTARQMLASLGLPHWKLPLVARHVRQLMSRDIDAIKLFPGVHEMLRGLTDAGVAVAVVSSNAEANVRAVLGPADAALVRHFGCGASLFGKRAKLAACARACGVAAGESIYVGDEARDVEAAAAAGWASGAVTWGYATPAALAAAGPTETFAAPAEVLRRVAGHP